MPILKMRKLSLREAWGHARATLHSWPPGSKVQAVLTRLCCLTSLGQAPDRPWKMARGSQAPQPCQSNGLLMSQAKEYLSWWRGLDEGGGALGHVLQLAEGQDPAVRPTGGAWDGLPLEMGEGILTARRGRAHSGWARAGPHKCQERLRRWGREEAGGVTTGSSS